MKIIDKLTMLFKWNKNGCKEIKKNNNSIIYNNEIKLENGSASINGDNNSVVMNLPEKHLTSSIPKLIAELALNLEIMYELLISNGRISPSLGEERCVCLSLTGESDTIAYAERGNLFFSKGSEVIKTCRNFLACLEKNPLKETIKNILFFLTNKEPGKKDTLGKMHMTLLAKMKDAGQERYNYAEKIQALKRDLDQSL